LQYRLRTPIEAVVLWFNRLRFHLFFKRRPGIGEYCNSKVIRVNRGRREVPAIRSHLVIIRCGREHGLINDGNSRNFDIALNPYLKPASSCLAECDYLYSGGINKYQAALQFISEDLLNAYEGFMLLDDDLEMTYSQLSRFLEYCSRNGLGLAQPSLTRDSSYSHKHLVNAAERGWRAVPMVEIMCPYFSSTSLKTVISTFGLSESTWGLDSLWPRQLDARPVVVDEFTIRHTRPQGTGFFYRYLRSIGVSPRRDMDRLKQLPVEQLRLRGSRSAQRAQRDPN
jgi:hypothetical protein